MRNKNLTLKILLFFTVLAIINAILILGWLNIRTTPALNKTEEFKKVIYQELSKEYSSVEDLIENLNNLSKAKKISYSIEDSNSKKIVKSKKGMNFFSGFIEINNEIYYINFVSSNKGDILKLIREGALFQIVIYLVLYVIIFITARNIIIKPTKEITNDIKNYKFGKKIERRKINGELGLIQNEFVNLTERLEEEKKEQNRIIASISHDIKTPLTSIIGYADLINEEDDLKTIKQHNNKIIDKALNLKEILSSFDDYLVNYENTPLKLTKVKIKDIVNELNNDYKIDLENNNIEFEIITKLNKDEINVDTLKLKRIFSNLISNSTRYLSSDGKITISITKDENNYIFKISDNGKGVDENIIDKLFNPFFTTDKSRKISGLGLSICKEFVELHGGSIKANNIKKGFEIEFTIPIK